MFKNVFIARAAGWLVLMFFIFFVIMLINFTIIVPLNNGQSSAVINKFKELWYAC